MRSNPATPEILSVQPKIENSPPANRPYDQVLHRQTVLMWGSGGNQQSNEMSPVNVASPSNTTRSPCQTPKLSLFNQQQNSHHEKCNKSLDSQQHNSHHHIKWNGNAAVNSGKEVISIFPIHNNDAYSQSASANAHHIDSHHNLHRHSSEITSENVWTYPYSSYFYAQHSASTQWVYDFYSFLWILKDSFVYCRRFQFILYVFIQNACTISLSNLIRILLMDDFSQT